MEFNSFNGIITEYLADYTEIIIPEYFTIDNNEIAVTTIERYAFASKGITNVFIPSSVCKIKHSAFNNNSISILNNQSSSGLIFSRRKNGSIDSSIVVSYGGISDNIDFIPTNTKAIAYEAFVSKGLSSITIPANVVSIGMQSIYADTVIFESGSNIRLNR